MKRWFVVLLIVTALTFGSTGQVYAQEYADQGAAYADCISDLEGALAAGATPLVGEQCDIKGGNYYYCTMWAPGYPPPNGFTRSCGAFSGTGHGSYYGWPDGKTCPSRPTASTPVLIPAGQTQCMQGCEYAYSPSADGGSLARPTGNVCTAPPFDPGKNNQCDATTGPTQVGNPINLFTGTKTEVASDYADPQGHLGFFRLYSSMSATARTTLGLRWRHNFQSEIVSNDSSGRQRLNRPSGNSYVFTTGGTPSFDSDVAERVVADSSTGGWKVSTPDNQTEYFASGRLNRIEYPDGDILTLSYDAGNILTRVSDRKGRSLVFTYSGALLTSVLLPDGTSITYAYDAQQRLVTVGHIDAAGAALQAKYYLYENAQFPLLLTGIVDENNARFATWTYDLQGRGTSSRHGESSDHVSVAYGTDHSWVTNALGETTEYGYQLQLGRAKLASADKSCSTCGVQSAVRNRRIGTPNLRYQRNAACMTQAARWLTSSIGLTTHEAKY